MFRTQYQRVEVAHHTGDESPVEQHHKDMCDISNIIKQYDRTGLITHVTRAVQDYGDFTAINEYQESLNTVIAAQEAFDELPSAIRKHFGYDPGAFFEFATNPANHEQMVEFGLANPAVADAMAENSTKKAKQKPAEDASPSE